jgi:S1-C subfamily serine protease
MEAERVRVSREEFDVELLSCVEALEEGPCTREGRFLGFLSSTTTLAGVKLQDAPGGGVLVEEVAPGSFAEQAGLRPGDVITHVDGQRVEDRFAFRQIIRFKDPEVPVVLTVERDGESLELEVRLSGSRLLVFRFDLLPKGFAIIGEG